ncbi:MAG: hypothetical protein RIM99_07090 [Cyclobacteriaceae bacterium]
MKENYNYELIKDYLDGLLDSETSEKLRMVLSKDETARAIANGILILEDRFKTDEEVDKYLDAQLAKNTNFIRASESRKRPFGFLKIAASIVLIAVSSLTIYQFSISSVADIVDKELSNPYQAAVVTRGSESVSNFEKGILLYNEMKYSEALVVLKNEESQRAGFFRGLCQLYMNEYQYAIEELKNQDLETSRYQEQSRWYLMLSYLKSGQQDEAKGILNTITERKNHFRLKEARRLSALLND